MRTITTTLLALITVCSISSAQTADTVYTNGRIYTVNAEQPWADAVAIKDGRFLLVGSNEDVRTVSGEQTTVHDLNGQFVMPGIVDMHAHPFSGIEVGTGSINLTEPGNPQAILNGLMPGSECVPNTVTSAAMRSAGVSISRNRRGGG